MSDDAHPTLIIIAGSNGAGKSTFTASLGRGTRVPIIDPDALARRFQPLAPEWGPRQRIMMKKNVPQCPNRHLYRQAGLVTFICDMSQMTLAGRALVTSLHDESVLATALVSLSMHQTWHPLPDEHVRFTKLW